MSLPRKNPRIAGRLSMYPGLRSMHSAAGSCRGGGDQVNDFEDDCRYWLRFLKVLQRSEKRHTSLVHFENV